jgi:DNA-directed RNA polymerase
VEDHRYGDDIPLDGLTPILRGQHHSGPSKAPLYNLNWINPNSPLIISDGPPTHQKRGRINIHGIPGDLEELLSIFNACLQIGRLDRAAMVLDRIAKSDLSPQEAIELHARWLQARVAQLAAEPGVDKADDIHRWFELQVRNSRLPVTTDIIAYMLKASLLTSQGSQLHRRITRYMGLLPQQAGMGDLYLGRVLTDQDLAAIAQICPDYSMPETIPLGQDVDADGHNDHEAASDSGGGSGDTAELSEAKVPAAAGEVLSTPQKGMGLEMLKKALSLLSELPDGSDISSLSRAQRRELQSRLEKDCVDAAIARWREMSQNLKEMRIHVSSPSVTSRLNDWHEALEARLAKELALVDASEANPKKTERDFDRCLYGPYLHQTSPSRLSAVVILGTLGLLGQHGAEKGIVVSHMVHQMAKFAEEDVRLQLRIAKQAMDKGGKRLRQHQIRQLIQRWGSPMKQQPRIGLSQDGSSMTTPAGTTSRNVTQNDQPWPFQIRAKIGSLLVSALMETARITVIKEHPVTKELVSQSQPAFSHSIILKQGKKVGVFLPNAAVLELMKREPRGEFLARHLPMVVEPEPWTKFNKGGFIEYSSALIRVKDGLKEQQLYAEAAIERGDMEQMLRGLDVLGKTAWRVNRKVFDVLLAVWNTGEALADIPPLNPEIPLPPEPDSTDDPMKRRAWFRHVKMIENEKSGLHSQRCSMNFQLEVARAFRDQTFYFPHNLDFRGRAYPIPTYMNHMGADHMRGLLVFAKGKPLGERGLRWLKIHLANVYGYDKASLQEREDFATNNLENIYDSADNPLEGKRWWLTAEDPWQCLATCFELRAALQSPDPAAFISHLPVHQDGTCNGLQHYAALGGDSWGAQQVNLLPGDRPADVYSAVAKLVEEEIAEDAKTDNMFAKAVMGKVTRKVVKQTVMTYVYGVTYTGAKKQVLKQLNALYPGLEEESGVALTLLSAYIASKIFAALTTMFGGAQAIQKWLGEIGGRVCNSMTPEQIEHLEREVSEIKKRSLGKKKENESKDASDGNTEVHKLFRSTLVWTTPLRMPVVQPYRKPSTRQVHTCLQTLVLTNPQRHDPVNRRKQLQAFPPNFIHSLDASHMMLSALECHDKGLTFAAVHDSFWTHAADVEVMNDIIRDSFIRIHNEDVIGRLKAEFEARYRGSLHLARIDRSSPVARKILEHRRSNKKSKALKAELLQEARRQKLLRSMDPEEVREGREMVTPASIFEEFGTPDMVSIESGTEVLEQLAVDDEAETEASLAEPDESPELEEVEVAANDDASEDAPEDAALPGSKYAEHLLAVKDTNYFEMETRPRYTDRRQASTLSLWLPLTFPDIPPKGDFDVQKLKDSRYFFS